MTTAKASDTLGEFYKANKDLCSNIGDFPVDIPTRELSPTITSIMTDSLGARLLALQSAGLVTKESTGGPSTKFALTQEGQTFYQQHEQVVLDMYANQKHISRNELCYATRTLQDVSNVEEKQMDGKPDRALVTFKLKIETRGPWVNNKAVTQAFPEISASLRNSGVDLHKTLLYREGKWIVSLS
jgi:hypothetical protein